MLQSNSRGKEASKMVISTFSLESEVLHNFQANFFQHDRQTFSSADGLKIANKIQSRRS